MGLEAADYHNDTEEEDDDNDDEGRASPNKEEYGKTEEE